MPQEHENALKFFQRALQLDPSFTYAYTLAGHEYFANEDFDKGLQCYRHAMRLDPRHYNAWYVASACERFWTLLLMHPSPVCGWMCMGAVIANPIAVFSSRCKRPHLLLK